MVPKSSSFPDFTVKALYPLRLAVKKYEKFLATQSELQPMLEAKVANVGLSGGADSLALTAALIAEGWELQAVIVDHQLQDNSATFSQTALEQAQWLGCKRAKIVTVTVGKAGGMEAAARAARYQALQSNCTDGLVFLAHTMDDQAETVLLGLGRGAGSKSILGMSPLRFPWARPLLTIRRQQTEAACKALGLEFFQDPHNKDLKYTRVGIRQKVIPLMEDILHGGVVEALAKTAALLQQDEQGFSEIVDQVYPTVVVDNHVRIPPLENFSSAIRLRILKKWLSGNRIKNVGSVQLTAIDNLITNWKGQGPVAVSGSDTQLISETTIDSKQAIPRLVVVRAADMLSLITQV